MQSAGYAKIILLFLVNGVFLTTSALEKEIRQDATVISPHSRAVRQALKKPIKIYNSSTEGHTDYNVANPRNIWICKNSEWIPYKLLTTLGTTKDLSGKSCKDIQTHTSPECKDPPSGIYWVQGLQVYCEMDVHLDNGGWTLVWQHSYMEDLPLTTNMTFFSNYYKSCTQHATSWCNIPNKARFNATEQMIVAYHNKQVVYAYKGVFNRNIDYDWTGAILMVHTKIIDHCRSNNGMHPNPVNVWVPGIAFNKRIAHSYFNTGDGTIRGNLTKPIDHRWHTCDLPSSISKFGINVQMTIAIYVR